MVETRNTRITIAPDERVFICGQAGSGKTYLAGQLLRGVLVRKLIIDIKALFEHPGAVITDDVKDIRKLFKKNETVIYQPPMPYDYADIDAAFGEAYDMGNTTIYNDERGGWEARWQRELLPAEAHAIMRGRQRNVGLWTGVQRPSLIPVHLMSEAEHFFVFRLQNGDDRKKVAGFAGEEVREPIAKRYFFYHGPDSHGATLYPPLGNISFKKGKRRA